MKPITIVGGGLAGLTLGIELRRHDVPVTVFEAGRYPRHRVCGEFISGRGVDAIARLGLKETLRTETVVFFNVRAAIGCHRLPEPALSISRHILDASLARSFQELGGILRTGERWRESDAAQGVVCATGRKAHPVENGWRWFGIKVHARNVELEADLEMHLGTDAYVGLCRLPGNEVNVCGLFRRRVSRTQTGACIDWLRGEPGSPLFNTLKSAGFDEDSFCAVAGLSLRPQPIDARACRIGDALTMIPPITGNGMSMAFESAELAAEPLLEYAREQCSWEKAKVDVAELLRRAFTRRLSWASRLHRLMFSPAGAMALPLLLRAPPIWRASFAVTR